MVGGAGAGVGEGLGSGVCHGNLCVEPPGIPAALPGDTARSPAFQTRNLGKRVCREQSCSVVLAWGLVRCGVMGTGPRCAGEGLDVFSCRGGPTALGKPPTPGYRQAAAMAWPQKTWESIKAGGMLLAQQRGAVAKFD